MRTDRTQVGRGGLFFCRTTENALTRVPEGHLRERERQLILKMIDLRMTRQENGRVPLQEYHGRFRHRM